MSNGLPVSLVTAICFGVAATASASPIWHLEVVSHAAVLASDPNETRFGGAMVLCRRSTPWSLSGQFLFIDGSSGELVSEGDEQIGKIWRILGGLGWSCYGTVQPNARLSLGLLGYRASDLVSFGDDVVGIFLREILSTAPVAVLEAGLSGPIASHLEWLVSAEWAGSLVPEAPDGLGLRAGVRIRMQSS
jgi:hypothetical protein